MAKQKAQRLGTERDLCAGVGDLRQDLARLEAQTGGSVQALSETLTGLVLEAQQLKSKLQGQDPWSASDPWTSGTGPKGAPGSSPTAPPTDTNHGGSHGWTL